MNDLFFVRHAETDMKGKFCGHSDPDINEQGYDQIRKLVANMKEQRIDKVYSSDLKRAHTTASMLAETFNAPLRVTTQLREMNFGRWEGLTWDEVQHQYPVEADQWAKNLLRKAPDGESFDDFQARILNETERINAKNADSQIVVVTHAGVMRVVLCQLCKYSEQAAWEKTSEYCRSFHYAFKDLPCAITE